MIREKAVEAALRRAVTARGGRSVKLQPPPIGVPDRLVLWPGGRCCFVELKTPRGKVTPAQQVQHERLRALGFEVDVLRSSAEIAVWAGQAS